MKTIIRCATDGVDRTSFCSVLDCLAKLQAAALGGSRSDRWKAYFFSFTGRLWDQQEGKLQHVHEHGLAQRHEMPSLLPATDPAASHC